MNRSNVQLTVAAALLLLIGFGSGWYFAKRGVTSTALASPEGFRQMMNDPSASDADREKAVSSFAAKHRKQMLDDYFKFKPGKERQAHLDRMIDQQEQVRKLIGDPTSQPGSGTGPMRIVRKADPKMATEGLPPGDRARLAEMMADLKARRAERGLPDNGGMVMMLNTNGGK